MNTARLVDEERYNTYQYDFNAARVPSVAPETEPVRLPNRWAPQHAPQRETEQEPRRAVNWLFICGVVVIAVIVVRLLGMYAEITAISAKTSQLKNDIALMEKQQSSLNLELNKMMPWVELEEYAVEKLGMQKATANNVTYLQHETDEVFELAAPTEENKAAAWIRQTFSDIADTVWNFIN